MVGGVEVLVWLIGVSGFCLVVVVLDVELGLMGLGFILSGVVVLLLLVMVCLLLFGKGKV